MNNGLFVGVYKKDILGVVQWGTARGVSTYEGHTPGRSHLPLFVFVGSRGPFVPFKKSTSVIGNSWHQGGTHGSGGEPLVVRG
jgi:hypothetical protein